MTDVECFARVDLGTETRAWGTRYVDDVVLHRVDANADGDFGDAGDGARHHLTDAQFSSVCLVDDAGVVAERVPAALGRWLECARTTLVRSRRRSREPGPISDLRTSASVSGVSIEGNMA
ncbi:MAG: hypothetical protein U0625_02505 [Phycisphaerales bacterium]